MKNTEQMQRDAVWVRALMKESDWPLQLARVMLEMKCASIELPNGERIVLNGVLAYFERDPIATRQIPAPAAQEQAPLNMVLHCPECKHQHIDKAEPPLYGRNRLIEGWTNPPHRSHLCENCGCIWRPADVPTNGVAAIETRGKNDNWPRKDDAPAEPRVAGMPSDKEIGDVLAEVQRATPYGHHHFGLWLAFAKALISRYRQHPEDHCQQCQHTNIVWHVNDALWKAHMPDDGVFCPVCFVQKVEAETKASDDILCWELVPIRKNKNLLDSVSHFSTMFMNRCYTGNPKDQQQWPAYECGFSYGRQVGMAQVLGEILAKKTGEEG